MPKDKSITDFIFGILSRVYLHQRQTSLEFVRSYRWWRFNEKSVLRYVNRMF